MHLKNGRWVKGPPPVNKGVQRGSPHPETAQKIIKHRPQASRPRSQVGNIDALLQGKSVSICVQRCLAPWTKILMADGLLKPIVEIEPGDFVINNQGEPTRVLTKTYSGRADKLVRIRSDRMLDPITCTPEHKFYALDLRGTNFSSYNGVTTFIKKKKNIADFIKWVPAEELNDETFLLTPTNCKLDLVDKGKIDLLVSKGSDSHQRIISNNGIRYDISKIMTKEILEDQDQDVWDIGVADHRSFVAENVNVSNSLGGLGDIIMSTPISRGAKRKYPNCEVTYSVDTEAYSGAFADVLLYNPFIDNIIDYRIAVKDDYHIFSDITRAGLMYEKPSTVFPNRIDLFARSARIPLFGQNLPIYVSTEEEDKWGQEFIEKHIGTKDVKGLIAIHLRSNDPKRTWPKERIRAFINLAQQRGYWIFLFDWLVNSTEWQLARTTQVFDYEVRRAASILKHCDVLVCPDSSMLHLAGALNLKIVSLFGSMPPSSRINHYPNATAVINQKLGCLGCVYSACKFKYYCMSSIQPETVISAVERKLMDPKVEVGNLDTSIITEPEEHYPKEIGTVEL
jgi:ADP-heptose:LPS heptosyltransferase